MDSVNPALAQYKTWDALLRHYNHNLDEVLAKRQRESVANNMPGRIWSGTRIKAPRLDYNMFLHVRYPGPNPWQTLCLMLGNPNPARYSAEYGTPLMEIDANGRFRFQASYRYGLQCLSKHTFIAQESLSGDLIGVRPLGYRNHYREINPWDVHTRQPYIIQPRGAAARKGKPPVIGDNFWYELVQDERGFWRLRLSQTQSDTGGWSDQYQIYRDRLEDAYRYTDRLYDLRRRRRFERVGLRDPEVPVPATIIQRPDALAKAFVTYRPAPATFPERKPVEATHG